MKRLLLVTAVLVTAGCSKAPEREASTSEAAPDAMVADRAAPPSIGVTAAPGVAFAYHYGFRMPAERIAAAQEAHAQTCEKLGVARCRITGMRYRLLGEDNVEAQLVFKLDPAIARLFGKQGIDAVKSSGGTLVDAEITGTDAGAAIDRLAVEKARAAEQRQRLDAELAKAKTAAERAELQQQRAEAERQVAAATDATAEQRDSLANTPLTFDYGSGEAIRGFDAGAPVKSALGLLAESAQATLAFVLGAIALLGPPGLVLLLGWFAWSRLRGRWPRRPAAAPTD
jgi:hypothetical protein